MRANRHSCAAVLLVCLLTMAMAMSVVVPGGAGRVYGTAVRLLGTTVGVGPSFDGFGLSIPLLFNWTVIAAGADFHTVPYPAQINLQYPLISELPGLSDLPYWPHSLKQSERIGAGYLEQDLDRLAATGDTVTVVGYSQGSQVAEIARADMAKNPAYLANAADYEFVLVGNPYQPNGGILTRFTSWSETPVLGDVFPFGRPGPSDSPFRTTYYQNQYDGIADFPAYFSVLSVANALLGIVFEHVLPGYVFDDPDAPDVVSTAVGNTTYVTIPHLLPLLAPLRLAASLIGAQRVVDALDPIVRVFVEAAYDRTADPGQVREFGWKIPPAKISAALDALPAAFAQSLATLGGANYTPTVPTPVVSADQPATPVTDHPARPVDSTPDAQAVRRPVVGISDALSEVTQAAASLLRDITGHAPTQSGPDLDGPDLAGDPDVVAEPAPAFAAPASPAPSDTGEPATAAAAPPTEPNAVDDVAEPGAPGSKAPARSWRKRSEIDTSGPASSETESADAAEEPSDRTAQGAGTDSAPDDAETEQAPKQEPAPGRQKPTQADSSDPAPARSAHTAAPAAAA